MSTDKLKKINTTCSKENFGSPELIVVGKLSGVRKQSRNATMTSKA